MTTLESPLTAGPTPSRTAAYVVPAVAVLAIVIAITALAWSPRMHENRLISRHQRSWQEDTRSRKAGVLDIEAFNTRISTWNDLLDAWERNPDGLVAKYCREHLERGDAFPDEAFNSLSIVDSVVCPELQAKVAKRARDPDMVPGVIRGPVVVEAVE